MKTIIALAIAGILSVNSTTLADVEAPVVATEPVIIKELPKPVIKTTVNKVFINEAEVASEINKYWQGEEAEIALAVMKAESSLNVNAKNYNCRYEVFKNNATTTVSMSCKKEDRDKAWSVDCGIPQINFLGKVCPEHTKSLEWSIKKTYEMYVDRGWNPWVVYKTGAYKKFL